MKRTLLATAAVVALSAGTAQASLMGFTDDTTNGALPINFFFSNSGADLLTLSIDGSTAVGGNVIWDYTQVVPTIGGSATLESSEGENTNLLSFTFGVDGFSSGDDFSLSILDPDFSPGAATVPLVDLIGVTVSATFADASSFIGSFIDNPNSDGDSLIVSGETIGAVPLPAGLSLMLAGLGAFGIASRRRKAS
jgi:hypothetical protein